MLLAGARVSFHFIIVLLTTLLVGFSGLAHASTPQQTAPAATQQKPEQPSAGQPDTDKPSTDKPSTGKPENKITPEQAEQLFRDVDTILNFASKDTTLPIKHEVKRRMASREEVEAMLFGIADINASAKRIRELLEEELRGEEGSPEDDG